MGTGLVSMWQSKDVEFKDVGVNSNDMTGMESLMVRNERTGRKDIVN